METKHEVVISGISGLFPECGDMEEFKECLFNGDDVITTDSRRWLPGTLGVPPGVGKIKQKDFFDYGFFGYNRQLGRITDPTTRLSVEQAFRAVADAGMNLTELYGSSTAVFMGSFTSETEDLFLGDRNQGKTGLIAHSRTMQANRISFYLNLKGPSAAIDATWNGGIECLDKGYELISNGTCSGAIVGCCSLMFTAHISHQYKAMGRLSEDSLTRCFSSDANGYARSEGCVVLFLQRADLAKRSYGNILGVKTLNYGSKLESFAEFSEESYKKMLKEIYSESNVNPAELAYFEAYGAASRVVDARELNAIAEVMLPNRKKPLLVGSVKSNMGHTEAASSLVALAKALVAFETGVIPPNINYSSPNPDVPALVSGKLQVVTEPIELEGDIIGVSSVGVAGPYSHVIVQKNPKTKINPLQMGELPPDGLPRLVILTDRTPDNIFKHIERLETMPVDVEFVHLMNNFSKEGVRNHLCRGYTVLNGMRNSYHHVEQYSLGAERLPIWFIFSGMGSQWPGMAKSLMKIPVFANAIYECHEILLKKGINLIDAVTNSDPKIFDFVLNAFVGIAAVQIGLVDVLRSIGVEPDGIIGHSLGEQGCGYADRCFTREQMILSAYARGKASLDAALIKGTMAAVGKGYEQMKDRLPENVEIACHNSKDSCTLSGPTEDVSAFIEVLKAEGIFAKLVNVGNIAFHSKYMKPAGKRLVQYLSEVIPEPKKRSSKWISSSNPESKWDTELAQYCSGEYHANNMLSPVLFDEATSHIPEQAIIIEIAPHALLQAIIKRSFPTAKHVPLTSRFDEDGLSFLMGAIGKLYANGVPVEVDKLYPPVEYPVSRSTPFLSPFIGWLHDEELKFVTVKSHQPFCAQYELTEENSRMLAGHKLGGKMIIPDSFYVDQLIDHFGGFTKLPNTPVIIDNLKFENSCQITYNKPTELFVQVNSGSGRFCIVDSKNDQILSRGVISVLDPRYVDMSACEVIMDSDEIGHAIDGNYIVSLLKYQGLELSGDFASIRKVIIKDHNIYASINFEKSITEFLNAAFSIVGFFESRQTCQLLMVKGAQELSIDPSGFLTMSNSDIWVKYDSISKILQCSHLRVLIPQVKPALIQNLKEQSQLDCESVQFVPYSQATVSTNSSLLDLCAQLILENVQLNGSIIRAIVIGTNFVDDAKRTFDSSKYYDKFNFECYASTADFLAVDRSLIHQDNLFVVTSQTLNAALICAFRSAMKCFILRPKLDDNLLLSTAEISNYNLNGMDYQFLSPTHNEDIDYQIFDYKEDSIALEKQLIDAHDRNVRNHDEKQLVVLRAYVDSVSTALKIVDDTKCLRHAHLLKYLLADEITNDNVQIKKNLKFNFKLNGKWGSLRTFPMEMTESTAADDIYSHYPIYSLSSIDASKQVLTIGLNLNDVTGSTGSQSISGFDFATSSEIGIGRYDPVLKHFYKDEVLVWKRPSKWTDINAASVPVLYALASYIVDVANNPTKGRSILINRGLLPISQAVIALAVHDKLDVFVTVYGSEEKKLIVQRFPQLDVNKIFDCTKSTFYVDVLRATKGKGVYKVVNTFKDNRMIESCVKCTGTLGAFIQVSVSPMSNNSTMGMLFFDTEVVALGATVDILLNLPVELKVQIKNSVQRALDNGVAKPFTSALVLPSHTKNEEVVRILSQVKSKIVVNLNGKCQNEDFKLFVCDPHLNYVIIGGQPQTDLWLKLTEWLLRRGARQINVVLGKQEISPTLELRLSSLNSQYNTSKIRLHSSQNLTSESSMSHLVDDFVNSAKISSVFFLNSAVENYSSALDQILQSRGVEYNLFCFGCGGERLCERKRKNDTTSLSVRGTSAELESSSFLQRLDELIINSKTNSIVTLTLYSTADKLSGIKPGSEWNHVPSSISELHELLRFKNVKPKFVEVQSSSSRREMVKEVNPVFIVPGLRLNRIRRIAQRMYHPTYVACWCGESENLDDIASALAQQMTTFPQSMYTLIADDWGGTLALHTASKLQALGRIAMVLLLDAAPSTTRSWVDKLMKDDLVLLQKYVKLSPKDLPRIKSCTSFETKVEAIIENSESKEETLRTVECIMLLRNRLRAVQTALPLSKKIQVTCHLFRDQRGTINDQCGLEEYLANKAVVNVKEAKNENELIDQAMDDVNMLTVFEYRDAACPPEINNMGIAFLPESDIPSSKLTVL